MFQRLVLRRTLLVRVPLLAAAALAWVMFRVWGWFAVLTIGAAAMMTRAIFVLRRAKK